MGEYFWELDRIHYTPLWFINSPFVQQRPLSLSLFALFLRPYLNIMSRAEEWWGQRTQIEPPADKMGCTPLLKLFTHLLFISHHLSSAPFPAASRLEILIHRRPPHPSNHNFNSSRNFIEVLQTQLSLGEVEDWTLLENSIDFMKYPGGKSWSRTFNHPGINPRCPDGV